LSASAAGNARLVVALLGAALTLGCNTAPKKPSLMANMAKEELTVYQLRAMDYEYAARFSQLVAATAADIIAATDDSVIREHALQWRMWATPQARSAAFDQDPLAGLIELWVLAHQQHDYFAGGSGRNWFGDHQPLALETTAHLLEVAEALLTEVMSPEQADQISEAAGKWIDEHPIEGKLYMRPTARADLATFVTHEQHGGLKAVGSMEETVRDLSDRLTILSAQMPVEARWQAEYLVESLFEERVHGRIDSIVGSLDDMTAFLNSFEDSLSLQTQTLLSGIEQERLMVFDAIEGERTAIVEAVERERAAILDKLDSQLTAASAELDSVGRGLIDHFFLRLIEVLIVIGVVVFLIVMLVLFVVRRRSGGTIDRTPPTE
jgi:hypothetical protein